MAKRSKAKVRSDASVLQFIVVDAELLNTTFKKRGLFGFVAKCHSHSRPISVTHKAGKLNLKCAKCSRHMNEIVIKDKDLVIATCDQHPTAHHKFNYDGSKILLSCGLCDRVLNKVTPG